MPERPNIVLVITHDSGQHWGCYGAGVDTPNLDRIAEEGVRFERMYCASPNCSPARGSLFTGRRPVDNGLIGLTHRGFRLRPDVPRLQAVLAEAGYDTRLFGAHHEEPDPHLMGYAHCQIGPEVGTSLRTVVPLAEEFLLSRPAEPFLAVVGFSETHRPFPQGYEPDDPEQVKPLPYLPDEAPVRQDIADLNGMIRGVDGALGRLDNALETAGLRSNTLFIYTTDHGIAFPYSKATLFEPGVSVSLVMRGPGGFQGGQVRREFAQHIDVMPTLLELAGVACPEEVEGRSLVPLVTGQDVAWREELFTELTYHAAYDPMRAVRTEQYKYIRSYEDRPLLVPPNVDAGHSKTMFLQRREQDKRRPREQLYDLLADPIERHNLAADPAQASVLAEMRGRLDRHLEARGDPILAGPIEAAPGTVLSHPDALDPEDTYTVGEGPQ